MSLTVMVSFGVILYGFSIFVTAGAAGEEFSKTVLSAAYGGSVIAGGLLAVPLGVRADRVGVRGIIATGGLLAACGMLLFGRATASWHVLVAWWLLIGPAGAMTFYEIGFIAVDQWYGPRRRPRALGMLTLIGGLAGIIFIPLTEWLVDVLGWRDTAVALGALVLVVAGSTAGIGMRAVPRPSPAAPTHRLSTRLVGDPRFVVYTVAMALTFLAAQGLLAHRVAVFEDAQFDVGTVALWAAASSALSLPGRWFAPVLATHFRAADVQAAGVIGLGVGTLLMLDASASWQLAGHFLLFGLAFGAVLPLRPMTMAGWFSGERYGATMGSQWMVTTLVGSLGPFLVGLLRDTTGGYGPAVIFLMAALFGGAVLMVAATRLPGQGAR
jgi:MFS family permease